MLPADLVNPPAALLGVFEVVVLPPRSREMRRRERGREVGTDRRPPGGNSMSRRGLWEQERGCQFAW